MRHLKKESYYGEVFNIKFNEYTGIDYSKVAFVFPGQGAARPGMFKNELKKLPHCLNYFLEADQWAETKNIGKISWYISSPQLIDKNNFYAIQNLALFVLEVGLFETLKQDNKTPELITAHSFGEYAALVCAGAIDFFTMLEIVFQREFYSPIPHATGEMLAISCSIDHFITLSCPLFYTIANENSYQQIVISIRAEQKDEMIQFLKSQRVPFRELETVGRPYHSSLMQETAYKMSSWLESISPKINPLNFAFISSVNNKYYERGYHFSEKEFLALVTEQLTKPAYFTKQIESATQSYYIHSFLELGLSGIYCDFIKNITAKNTKHTFSIQTLSILFNSVERKSKATNRFSYNLEKSPVFRVLRKYISHITGYDLIEIGIDDHFQEDLRIDSIKKAEIIFKTLEETNTQIEESLSLAQMRSVGEVIEFLEKIQQTPINKKNKLSKKTNKEAFIPLISSYEDSPRTSLFSSINHHSPTKDFLRIDLNQSCSKSAKEVSTFYYSQSSHLKCLIFDLTPYTGTPQGTSPLEYFIQLTHELKIIMSMIEKNIVPFKIILTSQHSTPEFYAFNAFFKSLCREYGFLFKSIKHDFNSDFEEKYWEMIHHESDDFFGIEVQYQKNQRMAKQWKPFEIKNSPDKIRKKIVIIGGAKGLAFELFSRIHKSQEIELVVWGRSAYEDPIVQKNISLLKKRFKNVTYLKVDALMNDQFSEALNSSRKILGNIDLVINSAGIEFSQLFIEKSINDIRAEASTKIQITENLKNSNQKNEFDILHFSSIVGTFGNEGQTIYAYGNGHQTSTEGSVALLWPGLNQVGMTENLGILHKLKLSGVHLLEIMDAANWFEKFLQSKSWGSTQPGAICGAIAYMDPKDIFLMEFFTRNLLQFESTGGEIISPKDLLFRKIYNSQIDSYLQDHVIENTSVVPASVAISSMMCFGHLFYKSFPQLLDFEIKNIMMLLDGRDITCYTHYHFQPEMKATTPFLKITSLMTSQIEHFVGSMQPRLASHLDNPMRIPEVFNYQVELSAFYSKACIGFGNKFQNLENIYYSENEKQKNILGIGKSSPIYYTGLDTADALISMLECAFQTVSCFGIILGKGLAIPLRFSKLTILKMEFTQFYVCPDILETNIGRDDEPLISNIVVYNEKNEVLMIIENLEMSTIRHHPTLPFQLIVASKEI
ncbi:MAG: SDR family NAD(P)-dependent oxidoreductase [Bacteriovoracaceae bacterium]